MTTSDVTARRRAALHALHLMEAGVTRACAESPEQDATIIPRSDPDHFNAILDELAATGVAMDAVAALRLPPEAYVLEQTPAGVVVDGVPCGLLRDRLRQALAAFASC